MQFNEGDIHQAIASIIDRFGRIDVLVNNAGYALLGALDEVAMDEVRANCDVNVFGLLEVTQAVLPQMKKQHSGSIIKFSVDFRNGHWPSARNLFGNESGRYYDERSPSR